MQNINGKNREAGFSSLLLMLALFAFALLMAGVVSKHRLAAKNRADVFDLSEGYSSSRLFDLMAQDDEFCMNSTLLNGLQGWQISSNPKAVHLDDRAEINFTLPGYTNSWLGTRGPSMLTYTVNGTKVETMAEIHNISIDQHPLEAAKFVETSLGKTIRVRIQLKQQYRPVGGGGTIHETLARELFLEIDANDTTKALACYDARSARNLCLDNGGMYTPDQTPKCRLP